MATSNGRSVGRPPYEHSQIRDKAWEPGDEIAGGWSLERLLHMNDRFADRLERAFASGLEQRTTDEAVPRRRLADSGGGMACARCGRVFIPRQATAKYCSQRCCQLAYLQRKRHP
jgi:hypothetical protein